MQYIAGIVVVALFGVCIYGVIDVIKQTNNIK